jgi:hypothetical protein
MNSNHVTSNVEKILSLFTAAQLEIDHHDDKTLASFK